MKKDALVYNQSHCLPANGNDFPLNLVSKRMFIRNCRGASPLARNIPFSRKHLVFSFSAMAQGQDTGCRNQRDIAIILS